MEIQESIFISKRPDKIWQFWVLVTTDDQWRDGIFKAELTSQPPHGMGSTGTHYHKKIGPMPWTIIRWEDGRHMEWVFNDSMMKGAIGLYHVEPENEGSRVTMISKMKMNLIMRIMMFFMKGQIRKSIKDDLNKLKVIMEK